MTRPAETDAAVEVTLRLHPARRNGEVHVQGWVEGSGGRVAFSGWLDLLDSLERVAEQVLEAREGDGGG